MIPIGRPRFVSLRGRLTVLYAGLFSLALALVAAVVLTTVQANARRQVEAELAASSAVFDRLWALKASQLADGARVLARDFGFREALATQDADTVASALDNLRGRLALDRAFILTVDATVIGAADLDDAQASTLWYALDGGRLAGVLEIAGTPYQAVAEPILAPQLIGWVVFAERLDRSEMSQLEKLSSIPLSASVISGAEASGWHSTDGSGKADAGVVAFATREGAGKPALIDGPGGKALALAKPLAVMGQDDRAVLMLRYPLKLALAPYSSLMWTLGLVALIGLAGAIAGSWLLARSITRPVSALDEAARRLRDGQEVRVEVSTQDELGRLAESFNAMIAGIREREARITTMALTDQETGLPNRLALETAVADADPVQLHVGAIGVERFMQVRAAVGYPLAAALLQRLAMRVLDLWPEAQVARLSSERLAVSFRAQGPGAALAALSDLTEALAEPVQIDGLTIDVGVSAGLASVLDPHPAPPVERASIALDQARAQHRPVAAFDAAAYGDPSAKLSLMSEMLAAMETGDISLAYQPKHDIRLGRITGAEALVRWRHPVRGMISPDMFVTLAEETGHIRALTRWTLARAVDDQRILKEQGHDLLISVNLSGRMVCEADFAEETAEMIAKAGARICLEITETAVIDNPDQALAVIDRFRQAGIAISIDDYGSGLSSLAYLKQIQADELKIDKAFVMALGQNGRDALLVKSTVDLAHGLGLKVVAEGVETAEGLAALSVMGCDMAQGYFIARPMPLADLSTRLTDAAPASPPRRKRSSAA